MKKVLALILVIVMAVTLLAGCGQAASTETPAKTESQQSSGSSGGEESKEPVYVEWWIPWAQEKRKGAPLFAAAEEFNALHPDIHVEPVYNGNYYDTANKIEAAVVAKNVPAMAVIEETHIGRFAPVCADLTKYLSPEVVDNYADGLLKCSYVDGVFKAAPFCRSSTILYVNKTLLEQAGLDPAGPKTWDELEAFADKISALGDDIYGFTLYWDVDAWFWESALYSWGGSIFNDDYTELTFNTEDAKKIIDMCQRMSDKGTMYNPYDMQGEYEDIAEEAFMTGKVGMMMDTIAAFTDHADALADLGMEVGLCYQPAGSQYGMTTGGGNLVIFEGATEEQKVAAGKFMEFLASDEFTSNFSQISGYLPATDSGRETQTMKDILAKYPTYQVMLDQMQYAHARPLTENWRGIYEILTEELEATLQDTSFTSTEALQSAYDRGTEFLKKANG